ncbi:MAG: 2,3,4,5-tetrahydropyridine-2,6-dicarboxylate N-succinyltransferase, partial [Ilumatobacteraceae bacterium]
MSEQFDTTPTTRMAWGAGFTTTAEDGTVLDAWFGWLGWGEEGEDGLAGIRERRDAVRNVTVAPVRITVDVDAPPASVADAYLRLHLLSHRLAAPRSINL